jgi:hypothetical protein
MNHATLNLEEYRCRKCGRLFYIDGMDRHPLNLDFGCPHGCDGGSEHVRDVVAEIKEAVDGRANDLRRIKDYEVVLSLSEEEFERSMGRAPEDQDEFDAWAAQAEDVLYDWIDWNAVCECAHEVIHDGGE